MQWNDLPESELVQQLRAKKLEHPTSAAFDRKAWQAAFAALVTPTDRDVDLMLAANYFGRELGRLRESAIPSTVEGYDRPRLVRLLAAFANQQFLTLTAKLLKALKSNKSGIFDMDRAQQMFVEGAGGQEVTPDDLITYLVDSLPHWLFHIWLVADDAPSNEHQSATQFAARANQVISIEHSLRSLWLNALWIGTTLFEDGNALVDTPRDRELAERWFIFDQRQMMLMMAEHNIATGAHIIAGGRSAPVVPAIPRTVIRIGHPPSGNRKFITGRTLGTKAGQREHVSERDMLQRLYTGLFLDETLPNSPGKNLTCRDLNAAWWVLMDLARLVADDLGTNLSDDEKSVARFAITVERKDLAAIFDDCLRIGTDRALAIVDWFTCDPGNTARIFAKSLWSEPLLPEPGSERCYIVLAPLLAGSPVKRVEAWMERGGISDNGGIKGRGKPFEKHVRAAIAAVAEANPLLGDVTVAPRELQRKDNSEEIDLLIRIGDAVIVGEVKCFVAPSEPVEKYNHLKNLAKATAQADRKRQWAETSIDKIGLAVGVVDVVRASALKIYPVVVINNGAGIGLERDGVPIVDFHYLKLLLSAGSYQGDTRFEKGIGMVYQPVELYASQEDLEARLGDLLRDPPPLKRYENTLRWRRVPFQTSDDTPFFIEMPALNEIPAPNPLRDMPRFEGPKRRR